MQNIRVSIIIKGKGIEIPDVEPKPVCVVEFGVQSPSRLEILMNHRDTRVPDSGIVCTQSTPIIRTGDDQLSQDTGHSDARAGFLGQKSA